MPGAIEQPLFSQISEWPLVHPGQPPATLANDIAARCSTPETGAIFQDPNVSALLSGIAAASPYLTGLIRRDPERLCRVLSAEPSAHLNSLIDNLRHAVRSAGDLRQVMMFLRQFKAEAALLMAIADLGGVWPVMKVTRALTKVADAAVDETVRYLFKAAQVKGQWQADDADPAVNSGYFVLAMGKQGAFELNYSSDIDLIIFYDKCKTKLEDPSQAQTFLVRLTRDLVKCLSEQTSDGYVFRTDLRLRPDPRSTAPAISTLAALQYYESFGQNWERAAMIKARPIAGDIETGMAFLQELSPFMWRKYFDYSTIADVHAMKRQIHVHRGFSEIAVAGHNIKLGRGGIREIEFFVQTQQLIAGGRQPDLRERQTLAALDRLVEMNWIEAATRSELADAYCFLRRIENRIQMVADEQTHHLPSDPERLARFSGFSGYADVEALSHDICKHMEVVEKHYSILFEDMPQLSTEAANLVFTGEEDDPDTVAAFIAMGYERPSDAIAIVRNWHRGHYAAVRSEKARERLTELQPILVEALSDTIDPDAAIIGFDRFLKKLPAGVQWFALLKANPELLKLVVIIVGSAPRLANMLSRRKGMIDAVLDARILGTIPRPDQIANIVKYNIETVQSFKDVIGQAHIVGSEQMFLIGMRTLTEVITADHAGHAYTALAEEIIRQLKTAVIKNHSQHHGEVPGSSASIIAMGKLGGHEMTASSDLDLVAIYDLTEPVINSKGPRPLPVSHYYARLTQRLLNVLSTPTEEGILYNVDMRLRPSGQKSPIATQLSGFVDYQHNNAWTWEHMALTRARVISGPADLRQKIEAAIKDVLVVRRDRQKIAQDVRQMRQILEKDRGTSNIWDLKQVRGGFVDIEFTCQYLQLVHAYEHPDVIEPNTQKAISKLRDRGLIDAEHASTLLNTLVLLQSLSQVTRLCFEGAFKPLRAPHGLKEILARVGGEPDFEHLEAKMYEAVRASAAVFEEVVNKA